MKVFIFNLIFLFLVISGNVFGQGKLIVKGEVWANQLTKLDGAKINVLNNQGVSVDQQESEDGKYKLEIELNTEYMVEIQKSSFVTKRIKFNTNVEHCKNHATVWVYKFKVSLFDSIPGEDYSIYKGPVTTVSCKEKECTFGFGDAIPDPIVKPKKNNADLETEPISVEPKPVEPVPTPEPPKETENTKPIIEEAPLPDGLIFTVQIAAFSIPENYDYSRLKDIGKIEKRTIADGITRFTIGNFDTLDEAEVLKNKIISRGVEDAFITIIENGERKLLKDVFPSDQ